MKITTPNASKSLSTLSPRLTARLSRRARLTHERGAQRADAGRLEAIRGLDAECGRGDVVAERDGRGDSAVGRGSLGATGLMTRYVDGCVQPKTARR